MSFIPRISITIIRPLLVILSLLLINFGAVYAADKIVLLTSLDPDQNRPPLHFKSWDINKKLENRFRKYLRRMDVNLEPVVKHFSTAETLYSTLKDTEVKALIWVGHAGFHENGSVVQNKSIIDYKGRDLKNLFQAVGPHLRYLGLVGCRGEYFLEEWKKKEWFSQTPYLMTFGRKVRTDARKGLRLAMKNLKKIYKKNPDLMDFPIIETQNEKFDTLKIHRRNERDEKMESVQIMQRDKLIGFLPGSKDEQDITLGMKLSDIPNQNKIISDSGFVATGKEKPNLGKLEITADKGHWDLFQTRSGIPIGIGKYIYRFIKN